VDTGYANISGRADIGSDTAVTGLAGIAHEREPRTDPDATLIGPPVEYDRTDLSVGVQHTFNRWRVSAIAERHEYDYDSAQSFRDYDENALTGRIEAAISPRLGIFGQVTGDHRDYSDPLSTGLSSDGRTYLVGADIHLTDLMQGQIAIGQFTRDYDNGVNEEGLAADANLEWYLTRLTTLSINAHRNTEATIGATTVAPYIETRFGGRIDHELLRNVILTAGVESGKREYQDGIDRTDDYTFADVGADYLLNRRVALRARLRHAEVNSSGADAYRDFEVNSLTLGIAFRL